VPAPRLWGDGEERNLRVFLQSVPHLNHISCLMRTLGMTISTAMPNGAVGISPTRRLRKSVAARNLRAGEV